MKGEEKGRERADASEPRERSGEQGAPASERVGGSAGAKPPGQIIVIGAGCAGLSAAVRLAQAGRSVVVVEASPRLGGRASTFMDRATGERVDNGQHVLFGCYRETYAFLRRIGTDRLAPLDRRLRVAIAGPDGRPHVLSCPPLPAPWHVLAGILKWRAVDLRDRLSVLGVARVLQVGRRMGAEALAAQVDSRTTVHQWLTDHGQTPALCRWLWHPLAVAALNQSPDVAAAAPFVRVLGELFGPRAEDAAIGMPAVPLEDLYAKPAAAFIEARGGRVLTTAPARVALDETGRLTVTARGAAKTPQAVIAAVPWHAFAQLWSERVPAPLEELASVAGATQGVPIVTANFWFDRPVMNQRFVGFVEGPFHWAFDKSGVFGPGPGHISVVSSGASQLAPMDQDAIVEIARRQLHAVLPGAAAASVRRAVVVREHRATFSLAPGSPPRPGTRTPLTGFYLAGDWIDTGLPGTIESAVVSGHRAADAVLDDVR